jgi:Domain of unknown function (DUF6379)
MPTQYNILNKGFKNLSQNGQVSGFKLDVLSGYYRGVSATLIEGFDVTVDGETFARDHVRCVLGNKTYTQDELQKLTDVRWQWDEPVTLLIGKAGGLKPGMHDVEVVAKIRVSYMPVQPSVYNFKARIPLVG